jgi:RNA polymerase sigma-B factor
MSAVATAERSRLPELREHAETQLFARSSAGDRHAREELVTRFLPMARRLAGRYHRGREPVDDLVQVASMGLVKAVQRFDHRRGVPFASYAVPTIVGELKRYLRDTSWDVHVPQRTRDRALEVDRATEGLRRQLGRSPTTGEVADEIGATVPEVLDAAEAATAYDALSLDSAPGALDDDAPTRVQLLGTAEGGYDLVEYGVTIEAALRVLPARQRAILHLRFAEDMTQTEIARMLGISQMHVSRLLRQALGRLRAVARVRHAA